jgi:hypothetical protein
VEIDKARGAVEPTCVVSAEGRSARSRAKPCYRSRDGSATIGRSDLHEEHKAMRRLNLDGSTGPGNVAWPQSPSKLGMSPFQPRPALRQLSVVVDNEALADDGGGPWSARRQLAGILSRNDYIRLVRYSDDGPPPEAPTRKVSHGPDLAVGWVTPVTDPQIGEENFWYAEAACEGPTFTGYFRSVADHVASTASTLAPQSEEQRRRAGVAVAVAQAIGPDMFITDRPHLLGLPWTAAGLTICSVEDALAMLGLYLRSQGDYRIWFAEDGGWTMALGKRFYYWIATRGLIPQAWRWTSACAQHAQAGGDDTLLHLTLSALQRVHAALEARDVVHRGLNQPQTPQTNDDAISGLEVALTMLLAAVDLTAVVAHEVLSLPGQSRRASWHHDGWRAQLAKVDPALAAITAPGNRERHALDILRHVRNSIHGVAMTGMAVHGRGPVRSLMSLPASTQAEVTAAMTALGGLSRWGVEIVRPGDLHADPGVLLEELLPRVIALLNTLMQANPIETLEHVNLTPADLLPPPHGHDGPGERFSPVQTACLRRLLGL